MVIFLIKKLLMHVVAQSNKVNEVLLMNFFKNKLAIIFVIYIMFLGSAFVFGDNNTKINDIGIRILNWEELKEINIGDSLTKILKKYSKAMRHEFTVIKNNEVYKLFFLRVGSKPNLDNMFSIGILFGNGYLIKFINPQTIEWKMKIVSFDGTPWRRRESWQINNDYSINSVLNSKGVSKIFFKKKLTDTADHNKGMEPLKILPAFAISYILFGAQTVKLKKQYTLNKQFLKKYDGNKIDIGMTFEQVDKIYGKAKQKIQLKKNEEVRLYGASIKLDLIFYRVKYSWVAVLFRNNKVTKVFSDTFFNEDWKKSDNEINTE